MINLVLLIYIHNRTLKASQTCKKVSLNTGKLYIRPKFANVREEEQHAQTLTDELRSRVALLWCEVQDPDGLLSKIDFIILIIKVDLSSYGPQRHGLGVRSASLRKISLTAL